MKIVEINSCNFGSTGKIMTDIAANAGRAGHYVTVCWPASRDNAKRDYSGEKIVIGDRISRNIHLTLARITGYNGCFSVIATRKVPAEARCALPGCDAFSQPSQLLHKPADAVPVREEARDPGGLDASRLLGIYRAVRVFFRGGVYKMGDCLLGMQTDP